MSSHLKWAKGKGQTLLMYIRQGEEGNIHLWLCGTS